MLKVTALALLAIAITTANPLSAATFSVPLTPTVKTGADGDYLSANFDFGTEFSHVESVTLEFTMSEGYQGEGFTTGHNTNWRSLHFVVQDDSTPIANVGALESSSTERLQGSLNAVIAGTLQSVPFGWQIFMHGEISPERIWPQFVTEGRGQLAFIDVAQAFFQDYPSGPLVNSSTSWQPPEGLNDARLIIVGTPVPEPSTLLLLLGLAASSSFCGTRSRQVAKNRC